MNKTCPNCGKLFIPNKKYKQGPVEYCSVRCAMFGNCVTKQKSDYVEALGNRRRLAEKLQRELDLPPGALDYDIQKRGKRKPLTVKQRLDVDGLFKSLVQRARLAGKNVSSQSRRHPYYMSAVSQVLHPQTKELVAEKKRTRRLFVPSLFGRVFTVIGPSFGSSIHAAG